MDMPKLLIADSGDEFRQALADTLCNNFTVRTCRSGNQALELLRTFRPDIVLLDLILPEMDGISLLHRAAEADLHPTVLAFIHLQTPYILHALGRLGVSYVMMKPCDLEAVICRVEDLSADLRPEPMVYADPHSITSGMLLALDIAPKLDGYGYLQAAIPIYVKDTKQTFTKELYAAVGALYNKDPKLVERSIRSAIDSAWRQGDHKIWRAYFRTAPDGTIPRPTNGHFIATMANALAEQLRSQTSA